MEHQYPGAISGDEHMLAELMLPDQAHVRNQDWTIFFLHKDTSAETNGDGKESGLDKKNGTRRKGSTDDDDVDGEDQEDDDGSRDEDDMTDSENEDGMDQDPDDDTDSIEGPPLVYVLNLVNMKQEPSAKR